MQFSKVRWKLDLTILPMFLVTQALQFMDKTSLNYANLFGYQEALSLKGQEFNYLSSSEWLDVLGRTHADLVYSNLCGILLRTVPLWLAHWAIPSTESHGY